MSYTVTAKSLEEAFEKAQKYFKRNISDLDYKIISINPDDENKYTLEFDIKDTVIGKSGKLYEEIFTEDFEVMISDDEMKAYLFIPEKPKKNIDKDYLVNLLNENGVKSGILTDVLERIVLFLKNDKPLDSSILVAKGKPPKNGNNGELIIKSKSDDVLNSFFEAEEINDKIDYKEAFKKKLFIVEENEEIAMIIQPTKGEDGFTVTGKTIPAVDGKPINLKLSENLTIKENKVYSKIKGLLLIKHVDNLTYELDISDIFVVNKNVDYSTGNIDFPGSVIIKGEVKAEFTVKAGKDVIAKSVSGNVITDGKLIVKEGITGRSFANRNIIKAEELEASYIQFSNITVDKNVQVKKYIRDSIIYCEGKVEVTGTPGMIYGGKVNALEGITVKILGSPSFTKTVVSTGISTKVLNEISTLVAEKSALNEQLTKINLYLGNADRPIIRDRLKEKIKKLKEAKLEINKKLIKIEVKLKELYEEVQKFKGSKIEVLKEAYPNVKVIIGEATLLLEKKLRNGYFFYNKEKKAIDYMLK
ncbi:conserved hypothetical protein [Deferribacter desulfuricans SSM1]|uniref:Flagellar Assembly Protein A N-terminal region domain-containing protein n=1 Tax=Deferribacter desulfuricans (strain DSM 14783 / JCM 11476 / NBRC 101012 / SSM1) TaxID=639282 RepID=D3PCK1_DEFDS|nr:FapA family protein [Deferribacter desulfuricans]BAI80324.1 conserved hypothetical protein [Deferribacter desulfuricans SSM1]